MRDNTTAAPSPGARANSNYFIRHWRGELSLAISYWINGGLLVGVLSTGLIAAVNAMSQAKYSLREIALAYLGTYLLWLVAWLWGIVGIWRSSAHHVERGGSGLWAGAAKLMVVIGVLGMAARLTNSVIPQIREFGLLAIGEDPLGNVTVTVAGNGRSVIVSGILGEGSAAKVEKVLDSAPGVTFLVLSSNGGRLLEARRLAETVRERHLDTYVENLCASACTYVFLAGRDRAATPNAKIGFHRPSFVGLDVSAQRAMTQSMLDVYRAAGLPPAFVQRIGDTPSAKMWYPTRGELIAAHVITRVSLGGEAAMSFVNLKSKSELRRALSNVPVFRALETRFPNLGDEAAKQAWETKERGGTDADVGNALRAVISSAVPQLMKVANDQILDGLVKLVFDEMSAARALSPNACVQAINGRLNIAETLPQRIGEEDQQMMLRALNSAPRSDRQPVSPTKFREAMRSVMVGMPEKYIKVLANQAAYAKQPELICDGSIAFFGAILALPEQQRHVALRGIYQSND